MRVLGGCVPSPATRVRQFGFASCGEISGPRERIEGGRHLKGTSPASWSSRCPVCCVPDQGDEALQRIHAFCSAALQPVTAEWRKEGATTFSLRFPLGGTLRFPLPLQVGRAGDVSLLPDHLLWLLAGGSLGLTVAETDGELPVQKTSLVFPLLVADVLPALGSKSSETFSPKASPRLKLPQLPPERRTPVPFPDGGRMAGTG